MRVWMDVWNPTYTTKLGDGPIFLKSASISRALDETGDGSAELIGIDPRVLALVESRRICEIWAQEDGFEARLIGAFVIEKDTDADGQSVSTSVSGRRAMVALVNKITLPGLSYNEETVADVVEDLAALADWEAVVDEDIAEELISVPFAGDSVLRALQVVAETMGVHLRAGEDPQTIEFGAFGDISEAYIEAVEGDGGEIHLLNDSLLLLGRMSILTEAAQIFNWALAFPGGDGDANDYMGYSTRDFVDSISLYGRSHYIIRNNASIAEYGQIERRVDAKRITPVDNTDAALVAAANAAADAIKAKLDRMAFPQEVLSLEVRNVRQFVNVGDKIHIRYQGMVDKNGIPYKYRDIDADYWVMRATERVGMDGITLSLEVTNIDRYRADAAGIVVGMLDAIQVQKIDVQPYPTNYPWGPFQQPIDTVTNVTFRFPIFENVLRLNSVKAYIIRDYWTAVAGVASAGGNHRHRMFEYITSTVDVPTNAIYSAVVDNAGSGTTAVNLSKVGATGDIWTADASGTHSHDTEFSEVRRDNVLPESLDVEVNGEAVAADIFPDGNTATEWEIDITEAVQNKAGGFRGWHEMEIVCNTGHGDLAVVIWVDVDIRKVRVS
jgi:hypothetical protein